jgi:hypothetical protein
MPRSADRGGHLPLHRHRGLDHAPSTPRRPSIRGGPGRNTSGSFAPRLRRGTGGRSTPNGMPSSSRSLAPETTGNGRLGQRALSIHSWPDGASLLVRMALHTGEPISGTGNHVGLDLHRAARICAAEHGGQILLSQTVAALGAPDLPPGVSLRELGTQRGAIMRKPLINLEPAKGSLRITSASSGNLPQSRESSESENPGPTVAVEVEEEN